MMGPFVSESVCVSSASSIFFGLEKWGSNSAAIYGNIVATLQRCNIVSFIWKTQSTLCLSTKPHWHKHRLFLASSWPDFVSIWNMSCASGSITIWSVVMEAGLCQDVGTTVWFSVCFANPSPVLATAPSCDQTWHCSQEHPEVSTGMITWDTCAAPTSHADRLKIFVFYWQKNVARSTREGCIPGTPYHWKTVFGADVSLAPLSDLKFKISVALVWVVFYLLQWSCHMYSWSVWLVRRCFGLLCV